MDRAESLTLSDANELEVRFAGGRVERTGLHAHQYFAGDPPIVDEVTFFYFAEATLWVDRDEAWICVGGGTDADGPRSAGTVGWYQRTDVGYELRRPPEAPGRLRAIQRIETVPWWRKP